MMGANVGARGGALCLPWPEFNSPSQGNLQSAIMQMHAYCTSKREQISLTTP